MDRLWRRAPAGLIWSEVFQAIQKNPITLSFRASKATGKSHWHRKISPSGPDDNKRLLRTLRLCEKHQDLCSRRARRARSDCFSLLILRNKNSLCELCALAIDSIDSVNRAIKNKSITVLFLERPGKRASLFRSLSAFHQGLQSHLSGHRLLSLFRLRETGSLFPFSSPR